MNGANPATDAKIQAVVSAAAKYGEHSLIAMAGVPGTGKSHISLIAAQTIADDPLMVREIQFHPAVTYEEFIEGMTLDKDGAVSVKAGTFTDFNAKALADPDNTYVLLIEELTRANVSAVLGELMTYLEHRDRSFLSLYSRQPIHVAKNLRILATYNPTDRTALDLDSAFLRRLRIISFPPDEAQLAEMLAGSKLSPEAVAQLQALFASCKEAFNDDYESLMPFGHGIFAEVVEESPDLEELWRERILPMLKRPLHEPHPFADVIEKAYPWRDPAFTA